MSIQLPTGISNPSISFLCPWCGRYFELISFTITRDGPVQDGARKVEIATQINSRVDHWCEGKLGADGDDIQ